MFLVSDRLGDVIPWGRTKDWSWLFKLLPFLGCTTVLPYSWAPKWRQLWLITMFFWWGRTFWNKGKSHLEGKLSSLESWCEAVEVTSPISPLHAPRCMSLPLVYLMEIQQLLYKQKSLPKQKTPHCLCTFPWEGDGRTLAWHVMWKTHVRTVKHWSRLFREAAESPSLGSFKSRLNRALSGRA